MDRKHMSLDATKRYVFLFAHPDDDAFIAGAMKVLIQNRAEVHGVWLTSGDYFGKGDLREKELGNATALLGLPAPQTHLLRFPDLGLMRMLDRAADKVAEVIDRLKPDTIFSTAYEGGHPDHDSVNFLAYEGCFRAGHDAELFEFPLYNATGKALHWWWRINGFPTGGPEVLYNRLPYNAVEARQRITWAYSSQWLYMVPARLASSNCRLSRIGEPYRVCPPERDHTVRPHPGKLNYERWFCSFMRIRFSDFRDAILKARRMKPGLYKK
jgi:LmbE family N-acetylglucosaminyl deacetylase